MIRVFHLTSRETLISKADKATEEGDWILEDPAALGNHPTEGMVLVDYLPLAKEKRVPIKSCHVIYSHEANDDVENAYNVNFGSRLVKPTGKNLILG
jgi:hypothetical protein